MEMRELIKQRRKELKLTQAEVAERMKVGHATIGRYENGQTPLNEATIKQFGEALECDFQEELLVRKMNELLQEQSKFRNNQERGILVHLCDWYNPDEECEMANSKHIEELIERDKPMPMGRYFWLTEEFKNDPPMDECGVCGHIIHPEYDNFCSRCGRRIDKNNYKL